MISVQGGIGIPSRRLLGELYWNLDNNGKFPRFHLIQFDNRRIKHFSPPLIMIINNIFYDEEALGGMKRRRSFCWKKIVLLAYEIYCFNILSMWEFSSSKERRIEKHGISHPAILLMIRFYTRRSFPVGDFTGDEKRMKLREVLLWAWWKFLGCFASVTVMLDLHCIAC